MVVYYSSLLLRFPDLVMVYNLLIIFLLLLFPPYRSPSKVAPNPFMNNSIYIGSQFRTAHLIRDPAQMTPRHAYNPPDVQTPIPPPTPPVPIKPIPTPVPNPDDPSVTSEPTLLPLPVYEPTCCSETLMYWITFTLLILLWIFTLAYVSIYNTLYLMSQSITLSISLSILVTYILSI